MTRGRSVALTRTASINIYKLYLGLCSPPVFTYASYYGFYYRFRHWRRQTNNFWPPYSCFWLFNLTQEIWVLSMLVYPWKCMFLSLFYCLKCRVLSIFFPRRGNGQNKGGMEDCFKFVCLKHPQDLPHLFEVHFCQLGFISIPTPWSQKSKDWILRGSSCRIWDRSWVVPHNLGLSSRQ